MLALLNLASSGHVPPSMQEMAHLHKLQAEHAARPARQLSSNDSKPDYTCSDNARSASDDWRVSGTSLGGWLVLEPWLTPSLFYQFLGADETYGPAIDDIRLKTGMDQKSFCTALGPHEANRQLRRHWKSWLSEEHIRGIKATGATHVRLPVGDWMFRPYGIYDVVQHGVRCNDGALEELDRALELCDRHGLGVLLDMHAWIGSQNGLDNSGETKHVKWASQEEMDNPAGNFAPIGTFNHWANKGWGWIINSTVKPYDPTAMAQINRDHWDHSIAVITSVVQRYGQHPAVWGLSPVNEVGAWTPLEVLRKFYWETYGLVRAGAPHWIFVMDSSFRGGEVGADNFMRGCPNKALDKHPYHAWAPWGVQAAYSRSCKWADEHKDIETSTDFPVIAGEWSLALDTCAMWLLGFNDMQPGEPRAICDMGPCPCASSSPPTATGGSEQPSTMGECYLGSESVGHPQPGLPLDVGMGLRGPFGSGVSGPQFGRCPHGMAMQSFEDEYMTTLAHKQIAAFNEGHGWFFWNFRTEAYEPHWDYLVAWKRGWFPRNVSDYAAITALKVCGAGAKPLQPTIPPKPTAAVPHTKAGEPAGVPPPKVKTTESDLADGWPGPASGWVHGWLVANWLSLLVGALGGGLVVGACGAALLLAPKRGRFAADGRLEPLLPAAPATPDTLAATWWSKWSAPKEDAAMLLSK